MKLRGEPLELSQDGFCRIHKLRLKGLNQVELSPNPVITRRIRAQFNWRSNVGLESNMSVQHEPEPSQSPAGQPLTITVGATQLLLTSGEDLEHPCKGGGHVATSPGRPA